MAASLPSTGLVFGVSFFTDQWRRPSVDIIERRQIECFIVTSQAKRTSLHSYALRDFSVTRCLAIPNLNTYRDATQRL